MSASGLPSPDPSELTQVLRGAVGGDREAAERLLPLVYEELKALARARLAHVPPGNTLQPTALVHEAYMRLVKGHGGAGGVDPGWQGRGHFFGAAAQAMRNILVEQARRKSGPKAGGGRKRVELDGAEGEATPEIQPTADGEIGGNLLALNGALERLREQDARKAEVVMLKFFAGLEHEAIAEALGVSVPTVERDWKFARSWLAREMGREGV